MARKSQGRLVVGTVPDGLRSFTGEVFPAERYAGDPGTRVPDEYARAFGAAISAMVRSALFAQAKRSGAGAKGVDPDRARKLTLPFDRELTRAGVFWSAAPVVFRHGPSQPEHSWFVEFKSTKLMNALRSLIGDMYGLMTGETNEAVEQEKQIPRWRRKTGREENEALLAYQSNGPEGAGVYAVERSRTGGSPYKWLVGSTWAGAIERMRRMGWRPFAGGSHDLTAGVSGGKQSRRRRTTEGVMTRSSILNRLQRLVEAAGRQSQRKVTLWAAVYGDGALYAADDSPSDLGDFAGVRDDEDTAVYKLRGVPADLAASLMKQGTREQEFSDGYEAWDAARKYVVDLVDFDDDAHDEKTIRRLHGLR